MNDQPNPPIEPLRNPVPYLTADAKRALDAARLAEAHDDVETEAAFSRMAVLLYYAALDAMINLIYEAADVHPKWRRWSVRDKWLRVVDECLPKLDATAGAGENVSRDLTTSEKVFWYRPPLRVRVWRYHAHGCPRECPRESLPTQLPTRILEGLGTL